MFNQRVKYISFSFLPLLFLLITAFDLKAQCITHLQSNCDTVMTDMLLSNRLRIPNLTEGDTINVKIPFYDIGVYKLALCSEQTIEDLTSFKLYSEDNELVYSSAENGPALLFELESLQMLRMEIIVEDNVDNLALNGCASLMIGIEQMINNPN